MNSRKWRNPYIPINKNLDRRPTIQPVAGTSLSMPRNVLQQLDFRNSVTRMRSNIKGISSTIRQMEETMDTLYGAIEILDSLGKSVTKQDKPAPQQKASRRTRSEEQEEAPAPVAHSEENEAGANPLGNLDIGQLLGLLQSPLVQSLLSQTGGTKTTRKKEG